MFRRLRSRMHRGTSARARPCAAHRSIGAVDGACREALAIQEVVRALSLTDRAANVVYFTAGPLRGGSRQTHEPQRRPGVAQVRSAKDLSCPFSAAFCAAHLRGNSARSAKIPFKQQEVIYGQAKKGSSRRPSKYPEAIHGRERKLGLHFLCTTCRPSRSQRKRMGGLVPVAYIGCFHWLCLPLPWLSSQCQSACRIWRALRPS